MIMAQLQRVARAVVRRAQAQAFVTARQVRQELTAAGLSDELWNEVVALAGPTLAVRQGRYHYASVISTRHKEQERQQQAVRRAVRQIVRAAKARAVRAERRAHRRVEFIQPVKVQTEDRRERTWLCRDISDGGLRLIGTRSLLGQKVRITIPHGDSAEPARFLVRILWTCAVGEDLFENGGTFLEMVGRAPEPLKVVS